MQFRRNSLHLELPARTLERLLVILEDLALLFPEKIKQLWSGLSRAISANRCFLLSSLKTHSGRLLNFAFCHSAAKSLVISSGQADILWKNTRQGARKN